MKLGWVTTVLRTGWIPGFCLVVLFGLIVRTYNLGEDGLSCNEVVTILTSLRGEREIGSQSNTPFTPITLDQAVATVVPSPDSGMLSVAEAAREKWQLPMYFWMMNGWIKLFGNSELSIRLPAALMGAFSIVLVFLICRLIFDIRVAIFAALSVSVLAGHIELSREATSHSFLLAVILASTFLVLVSCFQSASRVAFGAYLIISLIGMFTHYVYLPYAACHVMIMLYGLRMPQSPINTLKASVSVIVFVLGVGGVCLLTPLYSSTPWQHLAPLKSDSYIYDVGSGAVGVIWSEGLPLLANWFDIIVVIILIAVSFRLLSNRESSAVVLGLWFAIPLIVVAALDFASGTGFLGLPNLWLILGVPVLLVIASGMDWLFNKPLGREASIVYLSCLTASGLWIHVSATDGQVDQHRQLTEFIESVTDTNGNDITIVEGGEIAKGAIGYYARRNLKMTIWEPSTMMSPSSSELDDFLLPAAMRSAKIRFVTFGNSDGNIRRRVEEVGFRTTGDDRRFGHVNVYQYTW